MHRFCDIRRAEIYDDVLRLGRSRNSQVGFLSEGIHRPTHGLRPDTVIDEAGTGHGGFFPAFGGRTFFGQLFGQFPRVQTVNLGGHHGKVGLKVAMSLVGARPYPGFRRQIRKMGRCPSGHAILQLSPQGH